MIEDAENLIEINDQFLVVLDSRNASINNNRPYNSDIQFNFANVISQPKDAITMKCSIISFTCPNSQYTINQTNCVVGLGFISTIPGATYTQFYIPLIQGNYNATTFSTMCVSQFNYVSNRYLIAGTFSMTLNSATYQYTLTHSLYAFEISQNIIFSLFDNLYPQTFFYTSGDIIGFDNTITYPSSLIAPCSLTFPFPCNFSGLNNINIHIDNIRTSNKAYKTNNNSVVQQVLAEGVGLYGLQFQNYSNQNIAISIPVNCNPNEVIYYDKIGSFEFIVKEELFDYLHIKLQDDLGNLINLNNQNWNMTLEFNISRLTKRRTRNFFEILKNPYPQFG